MKFLLFLLLALNTLAAAAETRIAILDFELKDLTLKPGTTQERARTASIKPLLQQELALAGYKIVEIPLNDQKRSNAGFGYLFDHPDAAAKLARNHNANFILVGRLHKPSFLFAYLMSHLIDSQSELMIGDLITETKGGDKKLTGKAVESLARQIDEILRRQQ